MKLSPNFLIMLYIYMQTKDAQKQKQQINICILFSTEIDRYMYHAHPISDNLSSLSSSCPVRSIPQVHMYRIRVKQQLKIHFFWDGVLLGEQILMSQRTVVPSSSERSSPKNFG